MKLGKWPKFQKLHICSLSTQGGHNSAYFCSTCSGFRDTGQISKLPYLGWNLAIGLGARSFTYNVFLPHGGRNWAYFRSTHSGFRDTGQWNLAIGQSRTCTVFLHDFRDMSWFSKLPHLGMKLGHWPKCQKLPLYSLSTPKGSKLSFFSLYGQSFLRYRIIFKLAILGHKTWQVAKIPEVAHMLPFYPRGS